MIIVRSPLRITLGGGGTDLPPFYRDHGGFGCHEPFFLPDWVELVTC
jgi:hypothetical protein